MLTRKQLRSLHSEDVPLHILELDYVQSILLKHIYQRKDNLVFKGGTLLRKVMGLNRFSEDLDFHLLHGEPEENLLDGIRGLKLTGIESRLSEFSERGSVYLAKIRYQGPLYRNSDLSEGSLQIDISKHKVYEKPVWEMVISPYPDTGTFGLLAMDKREVLAEKFRSLVQRRKARDLYDVWFLLRKRVMISLPLLSKKFKDLGMEPRDPRKIISQYRLTEFEWKRDISNLMGWAPDKKEIIREILGEVKGSE